MKRMSVIIGVLSCFQLHAKCSSEGFYVFPTEQRLHAHSCLLLEGYGRTQEFIKALSSDVSVYLQSDTGDKVPLHMIDYNQGEFRVNQAILQPQKALELGSSYQLQFDHLQEFDAVPYLLKNKQSNFKWTVDSVEKKPLAQLLIEPRFLENQVKHFGCGPSVKAEFEFVTDSNEPVLVETELLDLTDQSTQRYFLKTEDNDTIQLGRGMCAGEHRFKAGHEYQVRFRIMDDCNHNNDNWTDWIVFENPNGLD